MFLKFTCANLAVKFSDVNLLNVPNLVILGISFLALFVLALRVALVAKLAISDILSSIFLILELYTSLLTTPFSLRYLVYLNQLEQALIHEHLIYLLYFSNCLNYLVSFSIY